MENFWDNPDLLCVTGSRLYGVSTPDSDTDYRGFVAEPLSYLIGMDRFEQKEYEDCDKVVYGLKKFFTILKMGNTNCLESLFANEYLFLSPIGSRVLEKRNLFVSKNYYRSIRGFALSEWRKARAVNLAMAYADKDEEDIFVKLSGRYQLKRFEINDIMDIIFTNREGDPRKEESSTRFLGEKRKISVDKHGFSVKNAYHAIRLLDQGIELMKTGSITFPRHNASELRDIRNGNVSIEDLEKRYHSLNEELQKAAEASKLPSKPNSEEINELYLKIVQDIVQDKYAKVDL